MNKGFAIDRRQPLPQGFSKNQLYKKYVNSLGNKPKKSYKDWLNIVKDELPPELIRQKIEPISAIDCPTHQLNVEGDGNPKPIVGMSIGKAIAVTVIAVGLVWATVKIVQHYRKK